MAFRLLGLFVLSAVVAILATTAQGQWTFKAKCGKGSGKYSTIKESDYTKGCENASLIYKQSWQCFSEVQLKVTDCAILGVPTRSKGSILKDFPCKDVFYLNGSINKDSESGYMDRYHYPALQEAYVKQHKDLINADPYKGSLDCSLSFESLHIKAIERDGLSAGEIAAAVIIPILAVMIIGGAVWCCICSRLKNAATKQKDVYLTTSQYDATGRPVNVVNAQMGISAPQAQMYAPGTTLQPQYQPPSQQWGSPATSTTPAVQPQAVMQGTPGGQPLPQGYTVSQGYVMRSQHPDGQQWVMQVPAGQPIPMTYVQAPGAPGSYVQMQPTPAAPVQVLADQHTAAATTPPKQP